MDWSAAKASLDRHRHALLQKGNVIGCGFGHKRVRGQPTPRPAVCVFVRRKVPKGQLHPRDCVPESLDGVATDVIEVGDLRLLGAGPAMAQAAPGRTERHRPAQPGMSVAHFLVTAGTFGALVEDVQTGERMILSNNHVLANSSNGQDGRAAPGDPILQPGPYDGGTVPHDTIALLERFMPIYAGLGAEDNPVDAAVGRLINPAAAVPGLLGLGRVQGVGEVRMGMPVRISGRTSGVRSGSVVALEVTANVGLGTGESARFTHQIATTPVAQPGDSGSLVVDSNLRAVGLLFAGSSYLSLANPIGTVLELLQVALV